MCPLTLTLLAGLAVIVALCAGAAPARAPGFAGEVNRVTVRPREIDDVLYNPGIGFTTMGNFDGDVPNHPKSTVSYWRWYWNVMEPKSGGYRWDIIDDAIEKAQARGQRVALGIMPVNGRGTVPQWYRDLGAKGWEYPSEGATGWMPDHNDPLYIKHMGQLVREFGKRYDGNPNVDHVDIRSLGHFGEWHLFMAEKGSGFVDATPETRRLLVDMYLESFKETPLSMLIGPIDDLRYAVSKGSGWRADCLGDVKPGWNHMRDRYQQNLEAAGATETWKQALVAFESCWVMQHWADEGWDIEFIFNEALRWHCSIFNNKSSPVPPRWWSATEAFLKRMGYRFVLRSIAHLSQVEAGGALRVESEWDNIGVAPPYRNYPLAWQLTPVGRRLGKTPVEDAAHPIDLTGWLPGKHDVSLDLAVPKELTPGRYRLSLALLDPFTREPAVQLAIEGRDAQGWYNPTEVEVVEAKGG
ncbi:MAG: DUF4832 domain-containing protein [Armatimonadetes bacterium]|nr:DUF4832 domain-containing protein [Armatimonadota bacterium]